MTPTAEQLRLARECAVTAAHSARFDDEILSFWVTAWSDRAKGIFEEGATQSALLAIQATEARMSAAVEWQDIATAPADELILAAITVVDNKSGRTWIERHIICIDSETGEIEDTDYDHGWGARDYEWWQPLPEPPTIRSATDGQG